MTTNLNRRQVLAAAGCGATLGLLGPMASRLPAGTLPSDELVHNVPAAEAPQLARPSAAQVVWQDCEIGLIYHFDMPIAAGVFAANNTVRDTLDPARYNPTQLDTDQWLEAAKAAGARYAIFTATHFNGFLQWQSDLYPYGVKQSPWQNGQGDVVADFVESCRKAKIRPGIYFSTHRNAYWNVWGHYVDGGRGQGTDQQQRFNRVAERMTEELCSRYGPLVQIWFDAGVKTPGEGGPDVLPVFERHQSESVFYHNRQRSDHRWIGNEHGYAGDPCWATMPSQEGQISHNSDAWRKCLLNGDPDGGYWSPGMVDVPLRATHGIHNWFWNPNQDQAAYTGQQLLEIYDRSVGRNSNLVIGEVVTSAGLVPDSDIQQLTDFGRLLRQRFAKSRGATGGTGTSLQLDWQTGQAVDLAVLAEDIRHGQRVRQWVLEGLSGPDTWTELARGKSIGHKWIVRFDRQDVKSIRLRISQSVATPIIRQMEAFDTTA